VATKTYYLLNTRNAEGWENIGESAVTAATTGTGWVVSTGSTNRSKLQAATERASTTFDANTYPTGGLDTTLKDAFRTENALNGDFASANWTFNFVVRAVTLGGAQSGRVHFRLFKADADGSNATEITSGIQSASTVSSISTSADFNSTLTVNPGAFSISNQYLFVQIAWERTVAGGMTTSDVDFRTGSNSTTGTRIVTSDFTPAPTPVFKQGKWRFYSDAATDGAMSALAAEATAPTLTQAQMQNGIIRLRAQIDETASAAGTTGALTLEYSEDGVTWVAVEGQTPASNKQGVWFRYANGAATNGGTTTSAFLTGTTAQGKYHEDASGTETLAASGKKEIDFAIYVHYPPPDSTIRLRIKEAGNVLALDTGATEIQFTTSTALNRGNTITRLKGDDAQKTTREVRFAAWERLWYDTVNSLWWFSTVQYDTPTIARLYSWDGNPANAWQAATTIDFGTGVNGYQSLSATTYKTISGVSYVYLHWGSSSTTRRVVRGTLNSATSITWGTVTSITQSSDRHRSIGIDDGNFIWIAGTTAATGVWARRSTNANDTSAWQAAKTASDTGVASGDVLSIIGLASDKAMVIWRSGSVLKFATVTDSGGFSAVNNVNSTASAGPEDWGITRSNGFVYLVHSDSTSAGGNWILRVFDETGSTWATGTSPAVSGQPTSNDGIALTAVGDDIYAFGTFAAAEGGQDRKVQYKKYTGPGTGGSWGSLTDITPAGSRGNGDHLSAPRTATGKLPIVWAFNDDDAVGFARTAEYHYISLTTTVSGSVTGQAKATGTVQAFLANAGVIAGQVLATGVIAASATTTGVVSGQVKVTGTVSGQIGAAGIVTGQAKATGTVNAFLANSGVVSGSARATGTINAFLANSGVVSGQAQATGTVNGLLSNSGVVSGQVLVTGTVNGTTSGSGSGQVEGGVRVQGTANAMLANSGVVSGGVRVQGTIAATATTTGVVSGGVRVTGTIVPTMRAAGVVTGQAQATGLVAASATTTGVVSGQVKVTGTVNGSIGGAASGQVVGQAQATGTINAFLRNSGVIAGQVRVQGTVSAAATTKGVVAGQAKATGTVVGKIYAQAVVSGQVLVSGTVVPKVNTSGVVSGGVRVQGFIHDAEFIPADPSRWYDIEKRDYDYIVAALDRDYVLPKRDYDYLIEKRDYDYVIAKRSTQFVVQLGVSMSKIMEAKQPGEVVDFDFIWTKVIEDGDSLVSATTSITPSEGGGLVKNGSPVVQVANPPKVKQWVSGGISGNTYTLSCQITTTLGRTYEADMIIPVLNS
jgi:hypothetical protein